MEMRRRGEIRTMLIIGKGNVLDITKIKYKVTYSLLAIYHNYQLLVRTKFIDLFIKESAARINQREQYQETC